MSQQEGLHSFSSPTNTDTSSSFKTTSKKYLMVVFPPFLFHMVMITVSGWIAVYILDHGAFWSQQIHLNSWFVDIAYRWDSLWYLYIAHNGYSLNASPFFPLYPAMVRLLSPQHSESAYAITGLVISMVFFILALLIIYKCAEKVYSEQTAKKTVWLLALFPASFFLTAIYPTSLYLFAIALYFLGLKQKSLWMITIGGLAAALSWSSGFILASSGFVWVLLNYYRRQFKANDMWLSFAAVCTPLIGLGAYAVYLWIILGTPFAPLASESQYFNVGIGIPLYAQIKTIIHMISQGSSWIAANSNLAWVSIFNDISLVGAIIGFIYLVRGKGIWFFIPFVAISLLLYSSVSHDQELVESTARMIMVLFPLWAALVNKIKSKLLEWTLYGLSAALMVCGNLLFAGGYWMT